jgi:RNA polymerase sigma factor (sigma-70 family)
MVMSPLRKDQPSTTREAAEQADLWDRHAQRIYRYCFRRTGDGALAEDLTSIVFLEAWRRQGDVVVDEASALPWLYGIATNVLRNQWRSQRRHKAALKRLPLTPDEQDFTERVHDRVDDEARMKELLAHLRRLPLVEREALMLCAWEDLTPKEAAIALAVPEATVRTRLHRARRRLRRWSSDPAEMESLRITPLADGDRP